MSSRTLLIFLLLAACDDATSVQLTNQTGAPVYRLWWQTTLFTSPVFPGQSSEVERTIPSTDFAYALLAPGWDGGQEAQPGALQPVRSAERLSVARASLLTITVDRGWLGFCDGGTPLGQDTADLITGHIFPAQFAQKTYDAASCTTSAADAGP